MGYDNILLKVGDFGLYQKLLCVIFVFYTTFLCGLNYYTQVFIFSTPDHRCTDSTIDFQKTAHAASWSDVLPWVPREHGYPASCSIIDSKQVSTFLDLAATYFSSLKLQETDPDTFRAIRHDVISLVERSPHKTCDQGWEYDHSLVFNTITSENNWVCEEDYKPMLIQTVFWIGNMFGCFIWGFTNDTLGRKPTVLLTHLVYFIAGAATLLAPSFTVLMICSCGILWRIQSDSSSTDGDDQLRHSLPDSAMGGHDATIMEISCHTVFSRHPTSPPLLETDS